MKPNGKKIPSADELRYENIVKLKAYKAKEISAAIESNLASPFYLQLQIKSETHKTKWLSISQYQAEKIQAIFESEA